MVNQPCDEDAAPRFGDDVQFGAASTDTLWMICSTDDVSAPSAFVSRTTDSAAHWAYVATTFGVKPNFPTVNLPTASPLPTSLFTGNGAWVVTVSPAEILYTTDGGKRWKTSAPENLEKQGPLYVVKSGGTIRVRTDSGLWLLENGVWRAL